MDSELEMTEPARRKLEQAAKYGYCGLLRQRAQATMLPGQGRAPAEVADILNTRRESIYQWRRNWRERGIAGLAEGRHSGPPAPWMRRSMTWNIRQLMALMQARYPGFGVHPGTMRRLLHERGLRWKRTRYSSQPTYRQGIGARVDASAVICFMNERGKRLPRRTRLAPDNASAHNDRILRAWQVKWRQRGLEVYFLPVWSPELKLIEGLWRQVKYHWYPFSEANAVELENRIARILRVRGDADARNLTY